MSAATTATTEATATQSTAHNDPRAVSQPNVQLKTAATINQITVRSREFAQWATTDPKSSASARTRGENAAARTERMSATLRDRLTIEGFMR
jgi:hypothetical protein